MFHLVGVWHQVLAVSAWTGVSIGALAGLAALVYLDPRTLKLAIALAILIATGYGAELYGDHIGYADGKADVQAKWDAQKAADAAARASELKRQQEEAAQQKQRDDALAAALNAQEQSAEQQIDSAPASDDGPVPKVLLDTWARERARENGSK